MPALLTVIAVRSGRREAIRDLLAGPVAQPSFYPQLFLVDPHEVMHAVEPEIDMRHLARIHGGSETLLGVTTIDPARLQAVLVRRLWSWNMLSAVCRSSSSRRSLPSFRSCSRSFGAMACTMFSAPPT